MVGVSVQDADAGDTQTMLETLVTAAEQVDAVQPAGTGIAELVCDKGYHSNQVLVTLAEVGIRSYVSAPELAGGATGAGSTWPVTRCMPTRGEFAARAGSGCCVETRRTAGRSQRASLRHRPAAPGPSARTRQHSQARAPAGLRLESRTAHAPTDGHRDAARPPGPCQRPRRRPAARIAPLPEPRIVLRGAQVVKLDRSVVDAPDDPDSFTHSVTAARMQFCHRLLAQDGKSAYGPRDGH